MSERVFPTRAEFAEWRRQHPRTGKREDPERCPLARCLKSRGATLPWVRSTAWIPHGAASVPWQDWQALPKWAVRWVAAFDRGEKVAP